MKIEKYNEIESTHKYIKEKYKKYNEKTVIIANKQKKGVGTNGKIWYTGENDNIALSILYKPTCKIEKLHNLTIDIAKNIKQIIWDLYNIELKIKEPNDLILNGKKICGILTEINTHGEKINYLIISIGFNVNEINFPKDIEKISTSLKKEYNKNFDKEEIIRKIIQVLENIV